MDLLLRPELLALLVGACLGLAFLVAVGGHRREDAWQDAARSLGGRLFVRAGDHRVLFPWRGVDATLAEKPHLRFEVPLRGFTAPRFRLGGATRDDETSDAPGLAFKMGPARPLLEDFRGWDVQTVEMGDVLSVVTGPANSRSREVLAFARNCLRLAELARHQASLSSGVTILGDAPVLRTECQVCGGAMVEDIVRCARCETSHHGECWTYAGLCSTYGCGERRSVRA